MRIDTPVVEGLQTAKGADTCRHTGEELARSLGATLGPGPVLRVSLKNTASLSAGENTARLAAGREVLTVASQSRGPSKLKILVLVLALTCLHELGNLSLAWGLKHVSEVGANPLAYVAAMVNPFVAAGIVFLILWMLTKMALLSWADLSFALPLMAIGYVLATVLGKYVLHEDVGAAQWLGSLLIFAGSAVVGTTAQRSVRPPGADR